MQKIICYFLIMMLNYIDIIPRLPMIHNEYHCRDKEVPAWCPFPLNRLSKTTITRSCGIIDPIPFGNFNCLAHQNDTGESVPMKEEWHRHTVSKRGNYWLWSLFSDSCRAITITDDSSSLSEPTRKYNSERILHIFINENDFENSPCKMAISLSRPQSLNTHLHYNNPYGNSIDL